jgi:two-component system, cell cycle sensor histidine kinase and response regulator CckA
MKTVDRLSSAVDHPMDSLPSILVVDDETAVRRFTARVLERAGYGVFEARDGAEALAMVQDGASGVAIVVTDVVMPRLNGVQLLQALSVCRPDLPVLLMSGYATDALTERGIAVPCSVLAKPFPPERLLDEVQRCLRKK